jgi:hypothetical protein
MFGKHTLHHIVHAIPNCVLCNSLSLFAVYLAIYPYVNWALLYISMAQAKNLVNLSSTEFLEICTMVMKLIVCDKLTGKPFNKYMQRRMYLLLVNDSVCTFQRTHKSRSCVLCRPYYNELLGDNNTRQEKTMFSMGSDWRLCNESLFITRIIIE